MVRLPVLESDQFVDTALLLAKPCTAVGRGTDAWQVTLAGSD
jgi:hypothetical protein